VFMAVGGIVHKILTNVSQKIPYNELFTKWVAPVCSTERPARSPFHFKFSRHTDRTCQDGADEDMDFPSIVLITSDVSTAPEGQQITPLLLDQKHAGIQTNYSGLWLLNQVFWIKLKGESHMALLKVHTRACL
jgi:hypothetical protein